MGNYSSTIKDQILQDKILRIVARGATCFQSDVYQNLQEEMAGDGDSDMDSDIGRTWLEAHKDSDSERWVLTRFRCESGAAYQGGDDDEEDDCAVITRQADVTAGCMFDVLYAMAEENLLMAGNMDYLKLEGRAQIGAAHFKNFADDQGIPFDVTTKLPVPAAGKVVLVPNATLSQAGMAVVKNSTNQLVAAGDVNLGSAEAILGGGASSAELVPYAGGMDKAQFVESMGNGLDHFVKHKKDEGQIVAYYGSQKKQLKALKKHFSNIAHRPRFNSPITPKSAVSMFNGAAYIGGITWSWPMLWGDSTPTADLVLVGLLLGTFGGIGAMLVSGVSTRVLDKFYQNELSSEECYAIAFGQKGASDGAAFFKNGVRHLKQTAFLQNRFKRAVSKQRKFIMQVQNEEEKKANLQILNVAESCFDALNARQSYNRAAKGKGIFGQHMRRSRRDIETFWQTAQRCGLPEDQIAITAKKITSEPYAGSDPSEDPVQRDIVKSFHGHIQDISARAEQRQQAQLKMLEHKV
jgi:hypothetical protein